MPIISTDIIAEAVQHDGRRRYRYRYTFDNGDVEEFDRNLTPVGFDVATDSIAKVADIEAEVKQRELVRAEEFLLAGGTLAQVQAKKKYNTNMEIGTYILKRMANRLDNVNRETLEDGLAALFLLKDIFAEVTDAQIANMLVVPVADAVAWRASFTAMRDGISAYGHNFPRYSEVEG